VRLGGLDSRGRQVVAGQRGGVGGRQGGVLGDPALADAAGGVPVGGAAVVNCVGGEMGAGGGGGAR
jgi:hypothetical protein